jgi:hypothetical protein
MTRDEIDTLWQQAIHASVVAGEKHTRYHFAALVAKAEREAILRLTDSLGWVNSDEIRARGEV